MNRTHTITVEVIRNYLLSAALEMMRNLKRTAYDTIIYEVQDFGLGIYDRQGRLLAESPGLAIFTRGNDYGLRKMIEYVGESNFAPGDLILLNWPYWSSAHTLDVLASSPIFVGDQLVGFTGVKMHWLDLGQKDAGYCLDTTEIYQEGLFLPCVKIHRQGVLNKELEEIIRFNCRLPDRVIGNMNAQISSCRTGERRVRDLVSRFGVQTFEEAVEEILSHGERLSRARLAALPRGTWSAEDFVDDDGVDRDTMVKIRATVTITRDEFVVDFTGSDPAVRGPINLPYGMTMAATALAFKGITTPDTPANEGNFRPLRMISPPGTVVHAVPPAATFTLWPALFIPEIIMKALAPALPETVPASSGGDICAWIGVGTHPATGKPWLESCNEAVGFGGHAGGDGENGIMHLSEPGCRNNPIEVLETKAPVLVESYGLRTDSGGPGKHRGGLGVQRVYRMLANATTLVVVKKTKTKPWGLAGGKEGEPNHVVMYPATDREQVTGMVSAQLRAGEAFVNRAGGGGGWGDPLQRDPAKVAEDVRNDYVSIQGAREQYGVVIDPQTLAVEAAATEALRARHRGAAAVPAG